MSESLPPRTDETVRYDASFVGRGFSWPLEVDHRGSIALTAGSDDLDRSLRIILSTAPGERVMRPEFGCRIWELLFEPVTHSLLGLLAQRVREAVAQWEPRVRVEEVTPTIDATDDSIIRIFLTYRVRSTNDRRNLVYPFYVIPHDAE